MSNPSLWGVLPTGFSMKPQPQIQQDLVTNVLATVDAALDTSPVEPLGQLIGVFSEALAEVWEVAAACYEGIDRDNAEGDQLDNIGTLTGSLREAPTASQVFCSVTLAAGTYGPGALVAAVSSTGPMTTEVPSVGVQFSNVNAVTSPGGIVTGVLFQALVTGPTVAPAGWLTTQAAPVTGWTAITNPSDASVGTNLQDDTDYRATQEQELTAGGGSTLPSVTAALLELFTAFGLVAASVNVLENVNLTTDPATLLPGKSFEVFVYAGLGSFSANQLSQIAQTIWNEKPAGIQLVGTTTIVIFDTQGVQRSVPFSVVSSLAIYVIMTVIFSAATSTNGSQAAVSAGLGGAIQALARGETVAGDVLPPATPGVLVPGGTVYGGPIAAAAIEAGGIVNVVVTLIGTAPNPVNAAPIWGENDSLIAASLGASVTIADSQVGSILTANITIIDLVTGLSYAG